MAACTETTDYSNFDPNWYLSTYYGMVEGQKEEGDLVKFSLDAFHEVFSMGFIKGGHLLDVGTGPSFHTIVSASRHVDQIDLSDYALQNLDLLRKWKNGEVDTEKEIVSYVSQLENDGQDLQERYNSVRQKVSRIHHVDITKEDIFLDQPQPFPYDVITSSLCFESACQRKEVFAKIVQNVTRYLKVGGYLVLLELLGQTFYRVNNFRFPCLTIDKDGIQNIFANSGYEIVFWKDMKDADYAVRKETGEYCDFRGVFLMLAKKVK